jgi:hypothetical protein
MLATGKHQVVAAVPAFIEDGDRRLAGQRLRQRLAALVQRRVEIVIMVESSVYAAATGRLYLPMRNTPSISTSGWANSSSLVFAVVAGMR